MKEEKQLQEQSAQYMPQACPPYYEDEISLVDLWLVLIKRKKLIVKVFAGFVLLALALAYVKKDKFEFTTTIEVGQIVSVKDDQESYVLVESIESVKAKLENSYLPSAQASYFAEDEKAKRFKIDISAPKNAQMIIVKSKGTEREAKNHQRVHDMAVNPLLTDLNRKVDSSKSRLESGLARAKQELQRLQSPVQLRILKSKHDSIIEKELDSIERLGSDVFWLPKIKQLESNISQAKLNLQDSVNQGNALRSQRTRLDELEELLHKQLEGLNKQIAEARKIRTKAISGVADESRAMTLLLLDSEMQRLITRQSNLEERVFIQHKSDVIELENKISVNKDQQKDLRISVLEAEAELVKTKADRASQIKLQKPNLAVLKDQKDLALQKHQRTIDAQIETIRTLESSIKSITESHIIVPFLQSLEPKGLTSKLLFVIVVFLGFIFAIISAFVAEFLQKAREKMSEEGVV